MSAKLHRCRTCSPDHWRFGRRGFTRHNDRICSWCRRWGAPRPNYLKGRAA